MTVQVTSHWRMNHNRHNTEREPGLLGKRNSQTQIADKWWDKVKTCDDLLLTNIPVPSDCETLQTANLTPEIMETLLPFMEISTWRWWTLDGPHTKITVVNFGVCCFLTFPRTENQYYLVAKGAEIMSVMCIEDNTI